MKIKLILISLISLMIIMNPGIDAEEIDFTILHTNDEHSEIVPHSPYLDAIQGDEDNSYGGLARLAGAVQDVRAERDNTLLFSGGDIIGGTPFSWLASEGYGAEISIMNQIGYDGIVLGNHEFDYGVDILIEFFDYAGYPQTLEETTILGSNIHGPENYQFNNYYRQEEIIEIEDLKIGLFGLIGRDASSIAPDTGQLEFEDPIVEAENRIENLKDQDADIIIALTHSGLTEDKELAEEFSEIDLIIGGHSHDLLTELIIINDTKVFQAGEYLEYLGVIDFNYQFAENQLIMENYELVELDSNIEEDPNIQGEIDYYIGALNQLISEETGGRFDDIREPIARTDYPIEKEPYKSEHPMGNFVTDAIRLISDQYLEEDVDIAFLGNGQIRGELIPATNTGEIALYDLIKPATMGTGPENNYGFPLVGAYLTGEEVITLLEVAALVPVVQEDRHFMQFSGIRYSYNPENTVLFNIPVLDFPVPTTNAVLSAENYTGDGYQLEDSNQYETFDEDELYYLVTDSHMLSLISLAEETIPWLDLKPRDSDGEPMVIDEMEEYLIQGETGNLKTWEAIIEYAESFESGDQLPEISDYYQASSGRINEVDSLSYSQVILIILAIFIGAIALFKLKA
ncbi:bifunctional metallophosphatase/5'-nucleotidase [Halanaerobiaceae bacterium Z-7014]|uniref:Bifunctional metallophosphatase/5'-nucleotidase n=1 Tax=Halonatronomonas betaini TaxID=2778430 RepID=A0A931AWY9_9FIRM|nr:bifunctional UDP-sugar hydrolase/5'-nucleotidase [Halonatronomonas betaini]MBF8436328.1 bifunctional metallophosphatase/5'-nucleotidase [Halonatronomonas betaini]